MSGDCLTTSFLGGFNPGAVVMTWMGLWSLLGGIFLAAGGGSVSADVGYRPWVRGGFGDLGFWGCSASGLGFWLGLGGLGPGWCVARVVGRCMPGGPPLVHGGLWCVMVGKL